MSAELWEDGAPTVEMWEIYRSSVNYLIDSGVETTRRAAQSSDKTRDGATIPLRLFAEHTKTEIASEDSEVNDFRIELKATNKTIPLVKVEATTTRDFSDGQITYTIVDSEEVRARLDNEEELWSPVINPAWFMEPCENTELRIIDRRTGAFEGAIDDTEAGLLLIQEAADLAWQGHTEATVNTTHIRVDDKYYFSVKQFNKVHKDDSISGYSLIVEYIDLQTEFYIVERQLPEGPAAPGCSMLVVTHDVPREPDYIAEKVQGAEARLARSPRFQQEVSDLTEEAKERKIPRLRTLRGVNRILEDMCAAGLSDHLDLVDLSAL